jgi:hypothetical protein
VKRVEVMVARRVAAQLFHLARRQGPVARVELVVLVLAHCLPPRDWRRYARWTANRSVIQIDGVENERAGERGQRADTGERGRRANTGRSGGGVHERHGILALRGSRSAADHK